MVLVAGYKRIHRHNQLHCDFATGTADEINQMISDQFVGWLYRPSTADLEQLRTDEIRNGNRQAAEYYKGKSIRFHVSGITVLPQGVDQASGGLCGGTKRRDH